MNPIRHLAGILAAGPGALLALAAASPAMAATASLPHYGPPASGAPAAPVVVTRTAVVGGMPGRQIALSPCAQVKERRQPPVPGRPAPLRACTADTASQPVSRAR
jgi:hypothetical protein